jgi:hypothetical protein
MSAKAFPIQGRALTRRPARHRILASVSTRSTRTRDVVLAVAFFGAFPLAVNLTAALSPDGSADRTVPFVERDTP